MKAFFLKWEMKYPKDKSAIFVMASILIYTEYNAINL